MRRRSQKSRQLGPNMRTRGLEANTIYPILFYSPLYNSFKDLYNPPIPMRTRGLEANTIYLREMDRLQRSASSGAHRGDFRWTPHPVIGFRVQGSGFRV